MTYTVFGSNGEFEIDETGKIITSPNQTLETKSPTPKNSWGEPFAAARPLSAPPNGDQSKRRHERSRNLPHHNGDRQMRQLDIFAPPVVERRAEIPRDAVFSHGGRFLKVYRVFGSDAAAPVIVEELKGQFGLWSQDAVARCLFNHDYGPTIGRGRDRVPSYPHPQSPMGRSQIKSGRAK